MGRQAVILAGGRGTRLGEITRQTPKPLLQVDGQPFITILIEELLRFGFDNIVVLVGEYKDAFGRALQEHPTPGAHVKLISEPEPAGTAGALIYAANFLKSRFLLLNGDSLFSINILSLTADRNTNPWLACIALRNVPDTSRYGAVRLVRRNIVEFGEKSDGGPGVINGGIYWLKREILDEVITRPCSIETDIMPKLAARGLLRGRVYQGNFIDIGIPADLKRGRKLIPEWRCRPAAFVDRDCVLNINHGYVHQTKDFRWVPGAKRAVKMLNDLGYWVFVVTNQAGIARGHYETGDVERLHRWMNVELRQAGAHIDRFYSCPHHPDMDEDCDCRKPKPEMLLQAMKEWRVNPTDSFLIGNKKTDFQAAEHAEITGHMFVSGNLRDTVAAIIGARQIFP
jgi:D,D-heptose 1,7-bisphosphate phosphatase